MRIEDRLAAELLQIGAYLIRVGGRLVAGHGLSQQQFVVLKQIEERGPLSQKEVCSALLYEKSNVSKAVSRLSHLGLITASHSPEDGRVVVLEITPAGRKVVDECMAGFKEWNSAWAGRLSPAEIRGALRLLRKLRPEAGASTRNVRAAG